MEGGIEWLIRVTGKLQHLQESQIFIFVLCEYFVLSLWFDIKDGKILYLERKHTFKEFKMVRYKHQEDSTDGKAGDN